MSAGQPPLRRLLSVAAIGLHVLCLVAVALVPCYAIGAALFALARPESGESFTSLFDFERWGLLLGNTAIVCGVAVATAVSLGTVFGLLAARTDMPGRTVLLGAATLGACVPLYAVLVFLFAAAPAARFSNSSWACGLLYGLVFAPLAIIVLAAVFRAADRDLEDQALLDAALPTVLARVTIPQARWGIVALAMMVFLLVATDFTVADILLVRTFAEEVYTQFALGGSRAGPAITALPVLLVLGGLLVIVQVRYRLVGEHSPWQFGTAPRTLALKRWRPLVALLCAALVAIAAGLPATCLFARIGSPGGFVTALGGLLRELGVSTLLAATGATVTVIFGTGLAWVALRCQRLRWPVCAVVVLLLALPAPVVGISLIGLCNRPGPLGWLYDSPWIVVAGYVVRFLPVAILLLIPAVQRVPVETELAARVDGCDWLATQRHVYWPAVAPDATIAGLIITMLSFAEVGCTVLLAPPGWATASVRAFTLMHFGVYRDLAVLAVASIGCILLPWLALILLLMRKFRGGFAPSLEN